MLGSLLLGLAPVQGAGTPPAPPPPFTFFPQGGVIHGDLITVNFVDLDPGPGVLDWNCTPFTYNGHEASDALIRSFDEQNVGVPVYAAEDGLVIFTHDGEFDRNTFWHTGSTVANRVILNHGNGRISYYHHLKKGSVAVAAGEIVAAGQQLGLVGSSGRNSTWPHLHFEVRDSGRVHEPFAGPCRPGISGWSTQPPFHLDFYVQDFATTWEDLSAVRPPYELPRSGQIALSDPLLWCWAFLVNLAGGSTWRVEVERPDGSVAYDSGDQPFVPDPRPFYRYAWYAWSFDVADLHRITGTWHLRLFINGQLQVRAPFEARLQRTPDFNRPPAPIHLELSPDPPRPSDVIACTVAADLLLDDPDYDLVRFEYRWEVNGVERRRVTTAGWRDFLPRGSAGLGDLVSCTVTPGDGRALGPPASGSVTVGNGPGFLVLAAPVPGQAGVANAFTVSGALPNATIAFAYSLQAGNSPLAGCSGAALNLHRPLLAGTAIAGAGGTATLHVFVPAAAAGRTVLFEAVEPSSCRVSSLIAQPF